MMQICMQIIHIFLYLKYVQTLDDCFPNNNNNDGKLAIFEDTLQHSTF